MAHVALTRKPRELTGNARAELPAEPVDRRVTVIRWLIVALVAAIGARRASRTTTTGRPSA
jgi:hypothetical protein